MIRSDADRPGMNPDISKHDLYELCVQSPRLVVPFLRAVCKRGGSSAEGFDPRVLAEDFSGSAAVSREWVRAVPCSRAIATDLDQRVLDRAHGHDGVELRLGDVRSADSSADVIFVGNFSIGELRSRDELLAYLRTAHARLSREEPGGVFVCDTYAGESAFCIGAVDRWHDASGLFGPGSRVLYTWEQRHADPLTARVVNALHFKVEIAGEVVTELSDAFVYDWRLWSVPELRDAMHEAGFSETEVYAELADARDDTGELYVRPVEDPEEELDESFIVCVVARTQHGRIRP